jgi:hypothetical protein
MECYMEMFGFDAKYRSVLVEDEWTKMKVFENNSATLSKKTVTVISSSDLHGIRYTEQKNDLKDIFAFTRRPIMKTFYVQRRNYRHMNNPEVRITHDITTFKDNQQHTTFAFFASVPSHKVLEYLNAVPKDENMKIVQAKAKRANSKIIELLRIEDEERYWDLLLMGKIVDVDTKPVYASQYYEGRDPLPYVDKEVLSVITRLGNEYGYEDLTDDEEEYEDHIVRFIISII